MSDENLCDDITEHVHKNKLLSRLLNLKDVIGPNDTRHICQSVRVYIVDMAGEREYIGNVVKIDTVGRCVYHYVRDKSGRFIKTVSGGVYEHQTKYQHLELIAEV